MNKQKIFFLLSLFFIAKAYAGQTLEDKEQINLVLQSSIAAIKNKDIEALTNIASKNTQIVIDDHSLIFFKERLGGNNIDTVWSEHEIAFGSEHFLYADFYGPMVCLQPVVGYKKINIYMIFIKNSENIWKLFNIL